MLRQNSLFFQFCSIASNSARSKAPHSSLAKCATYDTQAGRVKTRDLVRVSLRGSGGTRTSWGSECGTKKPREQPEVERCSAVNDSIAVTHCVVNSNRGSTCLAGRVGSTACETTAFANFLTRSTGSLLPLVKLGRRAGQSLGGRTLCETQHVPLGKKVASTQTFSIISNGRRVTPRCVWRRQ